ncbi:MAG: hypothetical protein ABIU97_01495, partial [Dehalococcoidia bacterium]
MPETDAEGRVDDVSHGGSSPHPEGDEPSGLVARAAAKWSHWPVFQHVAAAALLALLLAIFFWPLSIKHEALSPADIAFSAYPWASSVPDDFEGPDNPYQSDDTFIGYPRRLAYYNGEEAYPWQDEYLTGTPATYSIDLFGLKYYPPAVFYKLLSFPVANGFFHAAVLLVAGMSMYFLLRQLRLIWLPAVYGGLLFMLTGHFVVWLGAFVLPAALGLVPLSILGFERFRETRNVLWLLIPAVCFTVQISFGYIPAWIIAGGILAIYGIIRAVPAVWNRDWRALLRDVGSYAGAAGIGALLGAHALLPIIDITAESTYQQNRAAGLIHIPIENAWVFLFPDFFGSPRSWIGAQGNYPEWVAYIGITAVPLVVVGFWSLRRSWIAWFAIAVLVFCAAQIYGIPPLKELAHLPGLKQVNPLRWFFGFGLVASIIAPFGLAHLLDGIASPVHRRRLLAAATAMVALAGIVAVFGLWLERRDSANWQLIIEHRHLIPRPGDLPDHLSSASTQLHRQLLYLVAASALVVTALMIPSRARIACIAILVLTFADLFDFGLDMNASIARKDLYPGSPGIEFLQKQDGFFRIAPVASDGGRFVLPGYTPNIYGLRTITGYDHYRNPDYMEYLRPIQSEADIFVVNSFGYVFVGSGRQALSPGLLAPLSVRYVVTGPTGLYESIGGQPDNSTPL